MDKDYELKKIIIDCPEVNGLSQEKLNDLVEKIKNIIMPESKNIDMEQLNKENNDLRAKLSYFQEIINAVGVIMKQHDLLQQLQQLGKNND